MLLICVFVDTYRNVVFSHAGLFFFRKLILHFVRIITPSVKFGDSFTIAKNGKSMRPANLSNIKVDANIHPFTGIVRIPEIDE